MKEFYQKIDSLTMPKLFHFCNNMFQFKTNSNSMVSIKLLRIFLILLLFLQLTISTSSPASESYPSGIRSGKVTILSMPTTNRQNTVGLYTMAFPNGMVISNTSNVMYAIGLCGIDLLLVNSTGDFYCHVFSPTGQTSTHLAFACTITSPFTIQRLTYSYIVVDKGFFNTATSSSTFLIKSSILTAGSETTIVNVTNSYGVGTALTSNSKDNLKCLIFIRGFTYSITGETFNQVNGTCYVVISTYYGKFKVSPNFGVKVWFTIIGFDSTELNLLKKMRLQYGTISYSSNSILNSQSFNPSTHSFMFGLKSFTLTTNIRYNFEIDLAENGTNTLFGTLYNQIEYFDLSQMACGPGQYLDRINWTCLNGRNQCTNYYQYFPNQALPVKNIQLQNQMKMVSVSNQDSIKFYRYNGTEYVFYHEIYENAIKYIVNKNFSKIAVLSKNGMSIFIWNGVSYETEYTLTIQLDFLSFQSLQVSEDFNTILVSYQTNTPYSNFNSGGTETRQYLCLVSRDQATGAYSKLVSIVSQNIKQIYFDGVQRALIVVDTYMYEAVFSQISKTFIRDGPKINLNITPTYNTLYTTMSRNSKVLAIQSNSQLTSDHYIKIWQRDPISMKLIYHSTIYPSEKTYFIHRKAIVSLSEDGLRMVLKNFDTFYTGWVYYHRSSLSQQFALLEVIGKIPEATLQSRYSLQLQLTNNGQLIASGENTNGFVLIYCRQSVPVSSYLYNIPIHTQTQNNSNNSSNSNNSVPSPSSNLVEELQKISNTGKQVENRVATLQVLVGIFGSMVALLTVVVLFMLKYIVKNLKQKKSQNQDISQRRKEPSLQSVYPIQQQSRNQIHDLNKSQEINQLNEYTMKNFNQDNDLNQNEKNIKKLKITEFNQQQLDDNNQNINAESEAKAMTINSKDTFTLEPSKKKRKKVRNLDIEVFSKDLPVQVLTLQKQ